MKFEFPHLTKAKLASVNVRAEKHGPELVPAVDLKIVLDASNDILDKFHPDLKTALYFQAQPEEVKEPGLDGFAAISNLPNLKFPKLESPMKWDFQGAGYRLDIDFGLGGTSNIIMFGCEINNLGFSPKEGGTVEVSFRVQISDIEESIIGRLATLVQHEISIVLTPPTVEEVGQLIKEMESPFTNQAELDADKGNEPQNPFGDTEPEPKAKGKKKAKTPEEAFVETAGAEA